ncbi:MAG: hypothetical protein RLZZ500_330, partial [Bacteroidota bacterium]
MTLKPYIFACLCVFTLQSCSKDDSSSTPTTPVESMYFPPSDGSSTWETKSISSLGWNQSAVQPLVDYLTLKNTKSFMILVNGRIVMEYYLNGH